MMNAVLNRAEVPAYPNAIPEESSGALTGGLLMRGKKLSVGLKVALAIFAATVFMSSASAATETVLHRFNDKDGANPAAGLIFDASGNLYGTTSDGGAYGGGTAFELTPKAGGGWTEKVLHEFGKGADGLAPFGGLIFDASGNLYGTTYEGGDPGNCRGTGCGTAFELMPTVGGGWTEKVLHHFNAFNGDGLGPSAGLILDSSGNLYGTTYYGGTGSCYDGNYHGCGTVFELARRASGGWMEHILYSFKGSGKDGIWPGASLIIDASGNLYGTNLESAGAYGGGTVFELTHKTGGGWREKILHTFNGHDGDSPSALIFDASGNLYGTTYYGPPQGYNGPCYDGTDLGCGTVFELMPKAGGGWTEKILHYFKSNGRDGFHPSGGLILDSSGNLYSATAYGGANDDGTVFKMTPKAGGGWTEEILHSFNYKDGFAPGTLIFDTSGDLYGTTSYGGNNICENGRFSGCGTVFEIKP